LAENGTLFLGHLHTLDHLKQQLGQLPQPIVDDTGYGNEHDDAYLDHHPTAARRWSKFNTYRLKNPRDGKSKLNGSKIGRMLSGFVRRITG